MVHKIILLNLRVCVCVCLTLTRSQRGKCWGWVVTAGLTVSPGRTPAWCTVSDRPLSSSGIPSWRCHSGSSFWGGLHSVWGRRSLRTGGMTQKNNVRAQSFYLPATLPVWLRAWCARCCPCNRPPGSGWSANSQMAHEFLTCNKQAVNLQLGP